MTLTFDLEGTEIIDRHVARHTAIDTKTDMQEYSIDAMMTTQLLF